MKITLYAFGKIKSKFWQAACKEYCRRIVHYNSLEIKELKDSRHPEKERLLAIDDESNRLLAAIPKSAFLVVLDSRGKQRNSRQLAGLIEQKQNYGPADLVFAIGGAFGFSESVLARADIVLSLSEMTFPHELARVILLEQMYRAFTILRGEKYHK